nr:hypothetical protein [Tanacetum cinerariifolium]
MNMLNSKCKTSFIKPEFLKKAKRANPRLYDIGCYNDNLALMLAPESDEVIRLEKESRSTLSDLIRPFDYEKLNNLYDLFVPQREKSSEQRYFSERSRLKVDSLKSQLDTQKTQFLNEIDQLSMEYFYADHMNAILGVYTELDEVTNLQCDYLEMLEKCECLEQDLLKYKMMSKSFEALQKHAINLDLKAQLQNKGITISELKKLIEKLKEKFVDTKFEKSLVIRQPNAFKSQRPSILGKPTIFSDSLERKDFSKSNLNAKSSNVNFVCATCGQCVLNEKHDMCVLKSRNGVNSRTKMPIAVLKPRNTFRKLYQRVSKACSWWYPKFTLLGYKWKPKSEIVNVELNLVEIIIFFVDSGCSKHMTGNLTLLINFVEKFLGTVKFGNVQIVPILGYGDLAEAIATACFTQNRFLVIPRHEKTPYHIINDRKPSVKFFHIFSSLCYIVRDGENLDRMKEKGIQIHQSPRGIFINQAKYAQEILIKHGMTSCDSVGTPMPMKHLDADLSETSVDQTKYQNSDHAGCLDSRKSTSGGIQFLGGDKLVSWSLKKQDCTSMSSVEAK